jgi:hypothetical protein
VPAKEVVFAIATTSQVVNYPWPQSPVQYPKITMNGAEFPTPPQGGNVPTGWQIVILDQAQDITTPGAILYNQYVNAFAAPNSNSWFSTYHYMYSTTVRRLLTSGNPGSQLLLAASFGLDNNMPPTNDGFEAFLTTGPGLSFSSGPLTAIREAKSATTRVGFRSRPATSSPGRTR